MQPFQIKCRTPALGSGENAEVLLATLGKTEVAVKRFFEKGAPGKTRYTAELEVIQTLMERDQDSPYWPRYYVEHCGCYSRKWTIVMERLVPCSGFLKSQRRGKWDALKMCEDQIWNGLTQVHQFGIFHGDVNPDNILVRQGADIHFVLADWGKAQPGAARESSSSLSYMDPQLSEQVKNYHQQKTKHDFYSLGLSLYEIHSILTIDDNFARLWRKFQSEKTKQGGRVGIEYLFDPLRSKSKSLSSADWGDISGETKRWARTIATRLLGYDRKATKMQFQKARNLGVIADLVDKNWNGDYSLVIRWLQQH